MAQPTAQQIQQMNAQNRQLTNQMSVPMFQSIYNATLPTYVNGQGQTIQVPLKNVGLTRNLYLQIQAVFNVGAAETQTLTNFGPANLLSNITFADYSNYQRINTTGWHMDALAMAKNKGPFAAAYTTNNPVKTGAISPVKIAPASYTTAGQVVNMIYKIPFAYGGIDGSDLTGAILSQVLNANAYLTFTINPNIFCATGTDPTNSVYQSSTAQLGVVTSMVVTIYQDYLDQLPSSNGQLMLPAVDLSNVYGIFNTNIAGLAANQNNPYNFTNYRQFLSLYAIYDNAGVLNNGTDVNNFQLQAANMTNIWQNPPQIIKMFERMAFGDDFPQGSYWFDFRAKPISTTQNGNMQLLFNPSVVTSASSVLLIGLEYIALLNQVAQAGSVLQ